MKTHRELLDGYVDASWALAMEKVAVRQGELAGDLEKQLEHDPEAEVPQHTVKRCRAAIRRAFAPPPAKRLKVILARVVIAAVLCGLLTTAAYAISPQFRDFLDKIFYSVTETFTSFTLRDPQVEDVSKTHGQAIEINGLRFEWLPEGYEYVDGQETERIRWVEFENDDQDYILIRAMSADDSSAYTYDSDADNPTQVQIGELEGWLNEEDNNFMSLFWVDERQNKAVIILATNLPREEILQLAYSLYIK